MDAVVLSGGAAYGAYEVGVLKALSEKQNLDPQVVTGTSVGAFNAAVLAAESIGRLEEIWRTDIPEKGLQGNGVLRLRGNPLPYIDPTNPMKLFFGLAEDGAFFARLPFQRGAAMLNSRGGPASRASELIDVSAFVSSEPLKETIRRTISFSRVRASAKKLRIIATDWEAGTPQVFSNEHMTDAGGESVVLASTAIPGIFPPVQIQGKLFVDGGVVMNTPLAPALQAGANTIHVISLDPAVRKISAFEFDNTVEIMLRVLQVAIGSVVREDIATVKWINAGIDVLERATAGDDISPAELRDFIRVAEQLRKRAAEGSPFRKVTVHHYQPNTSLGSPLGLLDFTRGNIERLIARGYDDASQHICANSGCIAPPAKAAPAAVGA